MRKRLLVPLLASTALTCAVTLAPTAHAEPNPPGCDKEYFCIYAGEGQTGQLLVKSKGNWSGSVSGRSVFNNGIPYPNADHIQLTYTYQGHTYEQCVHYNPGPGDYKMNFAEGVTFTRATWRGECPSGT
ncbi:peptidase inhibitor family I36 protein [Streptomyces sp. LP05-1]|uniref:Peptidase inhibitor family I36 protein n=1 Tax=Streptomyces pyxinae TaxID=2970734 RepID=A0ABT2CJF0_9ACTN|nr:peptidase inhibitor family I36 protein [Streptomyces sp. LP05-1]MCS0637539.1 peptidase inhibitor family I36 protein [Streptomyces sp. LP05-1]